MAYAVGPRACEVLGLKVDDIASGRMMIRVDQGETRMLMRQLTRRFGPLAPALPECIAALSSEQRGDLSEALLNFDSAANLKAWLQGHTPPAP